jgi:UDP:flavonoid glycosyltransferase YjiC (YdhE family)
VQIVARAQFAAMIQERGIAFAALPGEFLELLDTAEGKAAIAGGRGFSAGLKLLKHVRPLMRRLMDKEWAAVQSFGPDAIVYHPKSIAAPHMAEATARPAILASPLPGFTPTSAFPSPMLPFASLGPLNRASHVLAIKGAEMLFAKAIGDWREKTLGLARRRSRSPGPLGTLYAYSPQVVPRPADWGLDVLVSGYWFLDSEGWQPPDDLAAFIAGGEPPIYVGFGSMPGLDPRRMTAIVIEGLANAGKRGLLATGGGALDAKDLPAHVHAISGAPHDKLFPLVRATLHHGGAGTTAASLRAGKPTVACPFFGDQRFWGRRIAEIGVGPPPLDRKVLSTDRLAEAFAFMDNPDVSDRAARIGAAIRREGGVLAAVRFIETQVTADST